MTEHMLGMFNEWCRGGEYMDAKTVAWYKREILSLVGETIDTVYDPSEVVGLVHFEDELFVHLKEFGEEDYHVAIEQWNDLTDI